MVKFFLAVDLATVNRVRERLKEVLRQYELRERHFECVIRSKELEVLLSRARAAEQKQLADTERARADRQEEEVYISLVAGYVVIEIQTDPTTQEGSRRSTKWPGSANRKTDTVL